MYKRAEYLVITSRLKEPRKFIQVVMGPWPMQLVVLMAVNAAEP